MRFTRIPEATFQEIQINAGVLLTEFTPANPSAPTDETMLGATSGGINFTATPTFSDYGEDIDNCPKNTKELKRLDDWEVKMTGSFTAMKAMLAKRMMGLADITGPTYTYSASADTTVTSGKTYYTRSGSGTTESPYVYTPVVSPTGNPSESSYYERTGEGPTKITPRRDIDVSNDFKDLWFVGDYSEKNGDTKGGFVAIHMMNSLSTGGFQIQTTDKAKTKFSFEFTGHYSIYAQDTVPYEVYIQPGYDEPAAT